MTNLVFLGAVSVGKTSGLRIFVKALEENRVEELTGIKCSLVKTDFSGESVLKPGESKETKTIHPNRVIWRDETHQTNHTIFAPGGDRERAVVKMGIITISRIVRQVVAVFDLTRPLEVQFEFFKEVRFFPKSVAVALNKFDLVDESKRDGLMKEYEEKITEFFKERKISITGFYPTCAEPNPKFQEYNDNIVKMVVEACTKE